MKDYQPSGYQAIKLSSSEILIYWYNNGTCDYINVYSARTMCQNKCLTHFSLASFGLVVGHLPRQTLSLLPGVESYVDLEGCDSKAG